MNFTPAGSTDKSKASTLQVTVQSFDKGSLSDFNGIQLDANEKASTPVYVKVHVTNLGPGPTSTSTARPRPSRASTTPATTSRA